jgi:hypothetical protein
MAVLAGHHDAVRELPPVPRARFLFAGERFELDKFVAGIFSEAPQVGVRGFCGVHAGEWGRAVCSVVEGGGKSAINEAGRNNFRRANYTGGNKAVSRSNRPGYSISLRRTENSDSRAGKSSVMTFQTICQFISK